MVVTGFFARVHLFSFAIVVAECENAEFSPNSAFSHSATTIANHSNVAFLFHQVPHHCWVGKDSME